MTQRYTDEQLAEYASQPRTFHLVEIDALVLDLRGARAALKVATDALEDVNYTLAHADLGVTQTTDSAEDVYCRALNLAENITRPALKRIKELTP